MSESERIQDFVHQYIAPLDFEQAESALVQMLREARLDQIDRIEAERVKEPVLLGQNALPLAVVTVSVLNNERRRIAALSKPEGGETING